jgi:hypothetical protein
MDKTLRIPTTHPYGNPAPETRQPGRHRAAILACALLSLAVGQAAKAAPGDLDPSFDADGLVLTHFGRIDDDSPGGRNDSARFVVVQPDGKLVVAGRSDASGVFLGGVVGLARYNSDGSLDASFACRGRVLADFGGEVGHSAELHLQDFVLHPDGKLVLTEHFQKMEIKS